MYTTTADRSGEILAAIALFCVGVINLEDAQSEETDLLRKCSTGFWRAFLPELGFK